MNKLDSMLIGAKIKAENFFTEKKDMGIEVVVVSLLIVVVAIGVCILFQEQIATLLKKIMGTATNAITNLFNKATAV